MQADMSGSVENEWLCSCLVEALGLPMARSEIASFEDQKVLIVERFDRRLAIGGSWWIRLPQEDFCQALGVVPELKYQNEGGPDRAAVAARGLEGRVELRFQDYRDLSGQYDRIVSVEMIEAVGERWWPAYFAKLRDCLVPGGRAMIATPVSSRSSPVSSR